MSVPIESPDMMQMAIEPYMGSGMSGAIPTMVVSEAMMTGSARLEVALQMAS